jgi:ribosomal protein S27AE
MGPWATTIIAVAALAAVAVAILAFRGFIESVDAVANTCETCGRTSMWPLPVNRHECGRCRRAAWHRAKPHRVAHH